MTQTKAQSVASTLIGLGYRVLVFQRIDGEWVVKASGTAIPAQTVANFASNQSIDGLVDEANFV